MLVGILINRALESKTVNLKLTQRKQGDSK